MSAPIDPVVSEDPVSQEMTRAFFQVLWPAPWPGFLMICSAPPGNDKGAPLTSRSFAAAELAQAAAYAARQAARRNVWFGMGVQAQRPEGTKRGGCATVGAIPGVWSDVDVLHPVHTKTDLPPTVEAAMGLIEKVGLPPTVVIDTGHGLQPHWLFKEPWVFADDDERRAAQQLCNDFKATVAGYAKEKKWSVDAVADLARLMRPPGTVNRKEPADPRPVRVHKYNPECRYTFEQIRAVIRLPEPPTPPEPAPPCPDDEPAVGTPPPDVDEGLVGIEFLYDDNLLLDRARAAANGRRFAAVWDGDNYAYANDASRGDLALCGMLAFWTGKDEARMDRLFRRSERRRDKWDEVHSADGQTYGQMTIAKAVAGCRDVYDPNRGNEPSADDEPASDAAAPPLVVVPAMGPPVALDSRVPPPMPEGVFDGWLGDMIDAVSRAHETPPELAAMLALANLAAVCQKRFVIRPEPGYFEQLAIWAVCALVPGNRKSAVLADVSRPLIAWERARAAAVAEERKVAESKRKTQEVRLAELRQQAKKKGGVEFADAMNEIATAEAELVEIPEPPRLFAQDCTPERLGGLMAENGERMTILSDEGGFFDLLGGRYSDGLPNLDLVLQAHNGSSVRVDRGSRPPVVLDRPCLSMGLSPQPGVLAGLTKHHGFRDRGLLARYLYALPTSRLGYRALEACPVPEDVRAAYEAAVGSLADVPVDLSDGAERSRILYPSRAAWSAWKAWQREVEGMMRPGGRLEHLTDWGGKLPGATARVAGLLHLADHASCPESSHELPASPVERAVVLARWLLEHALLAFDLMGADPGLETARRLWGVIESRRLATFAANEVWHPLRGSIRRSKDAEPGFDVLADHNLVEEVHTADYRRAGRPSRRFRVNPLITEGWR